MNQEETTSFLKPQRSHVQLSEVFLSAEDIVYYVRVSEKGNLIRWEHLDSDIDVSARLKQHLEKEYQRHHKGKSA